MPPRARTGVAPSVVDQIQGRANGRRRRRDPRRERSRAQHAGKDEARVRQSSGRAAHDDVAAAGELRRTRLLENDAADAQERRHDAHAQAEAACQHRASDRTRQQRSQCEGDDHRGSVLDNPAVAHPDQPVGTPRDRRIVRDDDNRRAVARAGDRGAQQSVRPWPDPALRSARPRAADAAGSRARGRSRRAASLRPTAPTADGRRAPRARRTRAAPARALRRSARPTPASAWGSSTFSNAVSIGRRKKRWKTKPISRSRSRLRSASGKALTSRPWNRTSPAGRHVDAAEHVQQRRLAAARRPDDSEILAGRDAERNLPQRGDRPGRHRKDPRHVRRLDNRRRHDTTSRRSVAAMGSVATMRIGYAAAASAASARSAPWSTIARGSNTKKCRSAGTPGMPAQDVVQPERQHRAERHCEQRRRANTRITDSISTPPMTRQRDRPERPQRRNLAEPLVHRNGQQHGNQEEAEEERDGRQHDRDLPEVGELDPAEALDEIFVRHDVKIGPRRVDGGRRGTRAERRSGIAPGASPIGPRSSRRTTSPRRRGCRPPSCASGSSNGKSAMPDTTNVT